MKVTRPQLEALIERADYVCWPNSTVVSCKITLYNGFSVLGEAACVDPAEFDLAMGEKLAHADAFRKLWVLEGYLLNFERYITLCEPSIPPSMTAFYTARARGAK